MMTAGPACVGVHWYSQRRQAKRTGFPMRFACTHVLPPSELNSTFTISASPVQAAPLTLYGVFLFNVSRMPGLAISDFTRISINGRRTGLPELRSQYA